jgi:Na+/H+-dicarboxylate symporter
MKIIIGITIAFFAGVAMATYLSKVEAIKPPIKAPVKPIVRIVNPIIW